jgi:uncharacterized membrane protein YhaH (DUF805 family)
MELLSRLFSFEGRVSRKYFWLVYLVYAIYFGVIMAVSESVDYLRFNDIFVLGAMTPAALIVLFAMIKRLHDRDRGTVWLGIFFLLPFAIMFGFFFLLLFLRQSGRVPEETSHIADMIMIVPINVLFWWGFIEIGFLKGTKGPNRFGPDPLAPAAQS